ncbi:conjugal transfer TraA domain protein, partial [Orientia tsutsugamushi str. UT76]
KYAGKWYDFSTGQKGDLLSLVQRERVCSFFEAKEYLKSMVGMSNISNGIRVRLRLTILNNTLNNLKVLKSQKFKTCMNDQAEYMVMR